MLLELTNEVVFSFEGPNLCLLGDEKDFQKLAMAVLILTSHDGISREVELTSLPFIQVKGNVKSVLFVGKDGANFLGKVDAAGNVRFELGGRVWERLIILFAVMSWQKTTYYLNSYESYLADLELEQECNFICSSEFG